jgi:hypothetical protein
LCLSPFFLVEFFASALVEFARALRAPTQKKKKEWLRDERSRADKEKGICSAIARTKGIAGSTLAGLPEI